MPTDIPTEKLAGIVGNVLASNQITFSEDELTPEGIGHNKALYMSVRCNGRHLPKVLIDNGSALNIYPYSTLEKLGFSRSQVRRAPTIVRGFDGSKRETMGEVDLVIEMGLVQYQVTCQVMDFQGIYNVLLGRPWIHSSGSMSSSLYQMVKFIMDDKQITVFAESDYTLMVSRGATREAKAGMSLGSVFRTSDIVSVGWIPEGKAPIEPTLSNASIMMAKELKRAEYQPGKGIGKNLQGIINPIEVIEQKDTFGLGFHPNGKDVKEMREKKKAEKEGK